MADHPHRAADIRAAFLEFFDKRGHHVAASAPLVLEGDPSLYFVNAGMVPFKDVFTGREQPAYTRAASCQKCMRVSGKHNDLENVGPSPTHHTLFEMLGNFSFGDYFKKEAIAFAWEFVTEVLGLPQERLLVTYLKGDDKLEEDTEARDLWRERSGLPEDRIVACSAKDNFWRMGETGPCGPCSEIFFFKGNEVDPARFDEPIGEDGSGWLEIWNLVFMQFDAQPDGSLQRLPAPSVDTGMGLERVSSILQGRSSNYDTDLFRPLIDEVVAISGKPYGGSMQASDVSMRVIADHARSTAFLIADGVLPDRAGSAYVLRRVMRRAIRHGHKLGIEVPFLHRVADKAVELLGGHYQELRERREMIVSVARQEEERFRETIVRGLGLLDQAFAGLAERGQKALPGAEAFKLYDTYGFPLDLTEVICGERGFEVDLAGYRAALEEARGRSEFKSSAQAVEGVYRAALEKVPSGGVEFLGYERVEAKAAPLALIAGGQLVEVADEGQQVELVTARTPFYGEAGGQVGDTGTVVWEGGELRVVDTQKPVDGLVVHVGEIVRGALRVGEGAPELELRVDLQRRESIRRNHSATHLLHWALRSVVGKHAQQKGSVVGPDRLRFDFTQSSPLSAEQIVEIEDKVNELIVGNSEVRTRVCTIDEARELGAMMIFEEKYGDTVRLLTMGPSVELCGGTHARSTGEIGVFKVLQEQGVAAGVRRITATTGAGVLRHARALEATLARASAAAKAGGGDLVEKIERLVAQQKSLEKELEAMQRRWMQGGGGGGGIESMLQNARDVQGVKVLGIETQVTDRGALRELAEQLRDKLGDSVVLVASQSDGKVQLVLTVAKGLTARCNAGKMIRGVAEKVGGSGGGRPDMAQAGGTATSRIGEAVEAVYEEAAQALS